MTPASAASDRPLSGASHTLTSGGYTAQIASIGATLRALTFEGRDLVVPFEADEVRPAYRGATLAPWPNRIVDGAYTFDGEDHQLALTEPARAHALHGLAAWLHYEAVAVDGDRLELRAEIEAQQGYPWRVEVRVVYALTAGGLTQTVTATNLTETPAPWGTGPHPYLVAGASALDEWTLQLPADRVLAVTPDRLAPTALESVTSDPERFDFREPRSIGAAEIDHAFTGLHADAEGEVTVRVTTPGGSGVEMSWGAQCPWVQIHTADLPGGRANPLNRLGLAVEPMTCAPDCFNDGRYPFDTGLIVIAPGGSAEASWRIAALV